MELKLLCVDGALFDTYTFNRTSMELKRGVTSPDVVSLGAFNRISMELKRATNRHGQSYGKLLIEPVWN